MRVVTFGLGPGSLRSLVKVFLCPWWSCKQCTNNPQRGMGATETDGWSINIDARTRSRWSDSEVRGTRTVPSLGKSAVTVGRTRSTRSFDVIWFWRSSVTKGSATWELRFWRSTVSEGSAEWEPNPETTFDPSIRSSRSTIGARNELGWMPRALENIIFCDKVNICWNCMCWTCWTCWDSVWRTVWSKSRVSWMLDPSIRYCPHCPVNSRTVGRLWRLTGVIQDGGGVGLGGHRDFGTAAGISDFDMAQTDTEERWKTKELNDDRTDLSCPNV